MAALLDRNGEDEELLYPANQRFTDEGEELIPELMEEVGEEEEATKWPDNSGMTQRNEDGAYDAKDESDSAQEGETRTGSEKDFTWIS